MRRAFTLIELIIVVAVLMILMGMLMPVVTGVRAAAKKRLARTEIEGICLALERYSADTGEYPPDNSNYGDNQEEAVADESQSDPHESPYGCSLYYYLCGPEGKGIQLPWDVRIYGPYATFKKKQLRPFAGSHVVVDPWGNAYVYEEHRSIFSSKAFVEMSPAVRRLEAKNFRAHNKMSYDLFSRGPNREMDAARHDLVDNDGNGVVDEEGERLDEPDAKKPDDVCNW